MRGHLKRIYPWFLSLAGLAIVCLFLFPIYWMIISSLKTTTEVFSSPPTIFPKELFFGHYAGLFADSRFMMFIKNSFIIGILSTIGGLVLSMPAAYVLARKKVWGAGAVLFLMIVVQMVPGNALALPLYSMFSKIGLTNNFMGIVLANMTGSLPFVILLMRTSFLTIPKGLEDAAAMDGCGNWGTFFKIILPLTLPALATCAAFTFIFAWGEFLYALVLLPSNEYWPITVGMRLFEGQHGTDWGGLMATATLSSLPVLLIFIFTQKYIVGGVTAGSIKG